jgi:hypothetical protein
MDTIPEFASPLEAARKVRAGLAYLAAVDPTQLMVGEHAQLLQVMEQVRAAGTAAQARVLGAFIAVQGFHEDACYSPRSWLMHRTGVTKGAAAGLTGWVKRAAAHPGVVAALAGWEISESVARKICGWTSRLPTGCQDAADAILVTAARGGAGVEDLAGLFAEVYARSRPPDPGGPGDGFEDGRCGWRPRSRGPGCWAVT